VESNCKIKNKSDTNLALGIMIFTKSVNDLNPKNDRIYHTGF